MAAEKLIRKAIRERLRQSDKPYNIMIGQSVDRTGTRNFAATVKRSEKHRSSKDYRFFQGLIEMNKGTSKTLSTRRVTIYRSR